MHQHGQGLGHGGHVVLAGHQLHLHAATQMLGQRRSRPVANRRIGRVVAAENPGQPLALGAIRIRSIVGGQDTVAHLVKPLQHASGELAQQALHIGRAAQVRAAIAGSTH